MAVENPDTNLVFFDPGGGLSAAELARRMRLKGVQLSVLGERVRACTHLDVTAGMIEEMVGHVREIVRAA